MIQPRHADEPGRLVTGLLLSGLVVGLLVAMFIVFLGLGGVEVFLYCASAAQLIALSLAVVGYRQIGAWRKGRRSAPGSLFAVGLVIGMLPMWVMLIGVATDCCG